MANLQPASELSWLGTSPCSMIRSFPVFVGFGFGMDESSACFVYRSSLSVIFTTNPKYITPIQSGMFLTIDRSYAMNTYVTPVFS